MSGVVVKKDKRVGGVQVSVPIASRQDNMVALHVAEMKNAILINQRWAEGLEEMTKSDMMLFTNKGEEIQGMWTEGATIMFANSGDANIIFASNKQMDLELAMWKDGQQQEELLKDDDGAAGGVRAPAPLAHQQPPSLALTLTPSISHAGSTPSHPQSDEVSDHEMMIKTILINAIEGKGAPSLHAPFLHGPTSPCTRATVVAARATVVAARAADGRRPPRLGFTVNWQVLKLVQNY